MAKRQYGQTVEVSSYAKEVVSYFDDSAAPGSEASPAELSAHQLLKKAFETLAGAFVYMQKDKQAFLACLNTWVSDPNDADMRDQLKDYIDNLCKWGEKNPGNRKNQVVLNILEQGKMIRLLRYCSKESELNALDKQKLAKLQIPDGDEQNSYKLISALTRQHIEGVRLLLTGKENTPPRADIEENPVATSSRPKYIAPGHTTPRKSIFLEGRQGGGIVSPKSGSEAGEGNTP